MVMGVACGDESAFICPTEVRVHIQFTNAPALQLNGCLDELERERAMRFRPMSCRRHYVAAHIALRRILGKYLGVDPSAVRFTYDCQLCGNPAHGRPRLGGEYESCDLRFSLACSNGIAVIAVSRNQSVGVDIESELPNLNISPLALRVCTPAERSYVGEGKGSMLRFLQVWTRKEALGKAAGVGIRYLLGAVAAGPTTDDRGTWFRARMDEGREYVTTSLPVLIPGKTVAIALALEKPQDIKVVGSCHVGREQGNKGVRTQLVPGSFTSAVRI